MREPKEPKENITTRPIFFVSSRTDGNGARVRIPVMGTTSTGRPMAANVPATGKPVIVGSRDFCPEG